jgi:Flp pilus assembly protein TadG
VRDERGAVTAFVACFAVALIAVFGLVVDGGLILASRRQAFNAADAAARAGAQAVDESALRAGRPLALDAADARRRANDYLVALGLDGGVDVVGDRITVTVTKERQLSVLGFTGLGPVGVKGTGSARAVQAVRTEGD